MITNRIALPGYNALTDTNPDHFALLADADNVLIKEFKRGSFDIVGDGSEKIKIISHGLGYIPLFLVYVYDTQSVRNNNKWKLLAHNTAGASVPDYIAVADTQNLYVYNYDVATISYKYYIFYDNVVGESNIRLQESPVVFKIPKSGFNAITEKDPNKLIFHSDLNTFKILKEGIGTVTYTGDGSYAFNHGANITNAVSYAAFVRFPSGKVALLPGKGSIFEFTGNLSISDSYIDNTQIGMYIANGTNPTIFNIKYYIFETPLV